MSGGLVNPRKGSWLWPLQRWGEKVRQQRVSLQTRDIVQNVYVRRVVNDGDKLVNRAFETFKDHTPFWGGEAVKST